MASTPAAKHLGLADRARAAGDAEAVRRHLVAAFRAARQEPDVTAMARSALDLTTVQPFGAHPGQVPAYLHEALLAADDLPTRARLTIGLARAWGYANEEDRAAAFAHDAQELARQAGDPALVADALDAALLASWGPDDFGDRIRLAARIEESSAHLPDPEQRLTAHVWRLVTAWETLDILAVRRQLRALELLAAEASSPRIAFYAVSRRAMAQLVTADTAAVARTLAELEGIGAGLGEVDVLAVTVTLRAELAVLTEDRPTLEELAERSARFALDEGITSILAMAAHLWWHAGHPDRAEQTLDLLPPLARLPANVDTLLTTGYAAHVAAALGRTDVAADARTRLEPYAGRGIVNAGAVSFHGVVDDALSRVCSVLGDVEAADRWRESAVAAYRRVGATWWREQLEGSSPSRPRTRPRVVHLERDGDAWRVGPEGATFTLPDARGLHHLWQLLSRPGVEVPAADLVALSEGHGTTRSHESDLGPVLDDEAKRAYRRRLAELDAEIDEADEWSDEARLESATREREALLRELSRAVGLRGRDRFGAGTGERARTAVRKAIAAALARVEAHDPATARLLRDLVHTGGVCRYEPDPTRPVQWVLRGPNPG